MRAELAQVIERLELRYDLYDAPPEAKRYTSLTFVPTLLLVTFQDRKPVEIRLAGKRRLKSGGPGVDAVEQSYYPSGLLGGGFPDWVKPFLEQPQFPGPITGSSAAGSAPPG